MSGSDVLAGVLTHAPELQTAPELAVAASNTPDPNGTGRALAHTTDTAAQDRAVAAVSRKVGHPNLLHRTLGWLGGSVAHGIGDVNDTLEKIPGVKASDEAIGNIGTGALKLAGKPLQEVQHTYRALHDIEARHGAGVGLLEALGIAAGAAGAALLAPETGGASLAAFGAATAGILGGEATAAAGSRLLYKDSWDRTKDGEAYRGIYNRQTGQYSGGPVSLGRDLTDHLPHPLRFLSGITDGLADLTLDPVAVVGGGVAEARKAGLAMHTVDQIDAALENPLVRGSIMRAAGDIAAEKSASKIALQYPKFAGISEDLAKLKTPDQVIEHFRSLVGAGEHLESVPGELPSLPLTKIPFRQARDFIRQYDGPGQAALRVFQLLPTAPEKDFLAYTNKDFDPSGQAWVTGVYRALRFGQTDEVARMVTDSMLATNDLGIRRDLYKNGIASMMKARGLTEDDEFFRNMVQRLENTTPLEGGPEGVYATDAAGRNLSTLPTEHGMRAAAVLENQTGRWAFPDYMEMERAVRAKGAITNILGGVDDAFYHHFTQNIFKRGALLTGGFALRIAAAEAIPAAFREGFTNLIRNSVELHLGAHEAAMGEEELGHVRAAVARMMNFTGLSKPEDVDLFARTTVANGGHLVVRGLDADAHGAAGVSFLDTPEGNKTTLIQRLFKKVPPQQRLGDEFGIFGAGPEHADTWQRALMESTKSPWATTAADMLHSELAAGKSLREATEASVRSVKAALDAEPTDVISKYERHFTPSVEGADPHEDWARVITEHVKGLVGHPNDPAAIKTDLLEHLANGEVPSLEKLKSFPASEVPMVKGRIEMLPIPEGPVAKIAQLGYTHVIDPTINFLSREPIYATELKRQYKALRPLIHEAEEVAGVTAETVYKGIPEGHIRLFRGENPSEELGVLATSGRNWTPSYDFAKSFSGAKGRVLFHDVPESEALAGHWAGEMETAFGGLPFSEIRARQIAGRTSTNDFGAAFHWEAPHGFTSANVVGAAGARGVGVLSADEALRIAQIRTVNAVTPFIHNPLERSQFSALARNFMPFYFAQTQAYRRVGRLIADNPGAFRKFQLSSTALHDIGTVTTDESGKPQFVYPGSGFLAHASIAGLGMLGFQVAGSTPVAFSGDVRSLNTIFPFNEEGGGIGVGPIRARLGPIVSIPMHALTAMFPETQPISNAILGPVGASGGLLDQLVPNTPIRNLLKAQGMIPGGQRELQNAMVQTIQSLTYRQQEAMSKWVKDGHQPTDPGHPAMVPLASDSPMVRQQFVDRVRNQSRILLYLKAAISTISPAAPQVSASDLGLQSELRTLIASKGPDGKPLGIGGAITEFLHRHPDATPYTVFGSEQTAGSAYLPANKDAQDFIDNNLGLLKKYPYAGAWLIPNTASAYDQSVYSQQLAMGLRHKKAPEQVVKDIYIAQGNDQFYNHDYPAHVKALADAAGDPEAEKAERANFNSYLTNVLGAQNPVWWDDFQSKDRAHERDNAVRQLTALFENGDAPAGPQTDAVRSLLNDYHAHVAAMTAGRQDSWSADDREAEKQNWQGYIEQLAAKNPPIAPLALKVFRSL